MVPRRHALVPALLASTIVACGNASPVEPEPALCQQTYEFGNFGCGELRGRVVTANGSPIIGAYIGASVVDAKFQGFSIYALSRSDSTGRYAMRMTWQSLGFNGVRPDTATVTVYAAAIAPGAPTRKDSVRVLARFDSVGSRAPVVNVPQLWVGTP